MRCSHLEPAGGLITIGEARALRAAVYLALAAPIAIALSFCVGWFV